MPFTFIGSDAIVFRNAKLNSIYHIKCISPTYIYIVRWAQFNPTVPSLNRPLPPKATRLKSPDYRCTEITR